MQNDTKYLFLDQGIVHAHFCENVQKKLNPVQKDTAHNPLFSEEFFADPPKRWEVRYDNSYPNVFYDEFAGIYRCYYTLFLKDDESASVPLEERPHKQYKPRSSRITGFCYAYSEDGVNWVKPNLGLVEFEGSKDNNIIMRNAHGSCVFLDREETDPAKRYKLLTKIEFSNQNHFMAVAYSADGIHFSDPIPWPKYNPQADTYNYFFRDPVSKKFVLITRIWKHNLRIAAKSESEDFIHWSEPVEILRGQGPESQVYSMPIFRYENIYLGLPSMYKEGDRLDPDFDTVDLKLAFSTDMNNWEFVAPSENFIERGPGKYPDGAFDCGCIFASVPIEKDGKLYFYYMGGNGQHTNYRETSFARGFIEKDKFAYYAQKRPERESVLLTTAFNFYGDRLELLADVEEGGVIRYEIVSRATLEPVEGFSKDDCTPITFSGWNALQFNGKNISDVGNNAYFLRFTFEKAKLYALNGTLYLLKNKY